MKKILVIHNSYQKLGGEDIAVENEIKILKKHFEVETILFDNNLHNYFLQIFYFIFATNLKSNSIVRDKIIEVNPDLIYVHNTWFKASLGIFRIIRRFNIPVILKLHNFRYNCTRSILSNKHLSGGNICKACGYKKKGSGIFNKYFNESWIKSLLIIIYGRKYFNLLKNNNFKIVVLTNFHKNYLGSLENFKSKVYVHPNPLEVIKKDTDSSDNLCLTYAGRVSEEKGVKELIDAFLEANLSNINLKIIGSGPDLEYLKQKYFEKKNILFLGFLENTETLEHINNSLAVITSTKLYEGQPTLLCEASLLGIPSIFPDSGGIKEFFPEGYPLSYAPFDKDSLVNVIKKIENSDLMKESSIKAFNHISTYLDENRLIKNFLGIVND